jgi:hypothetical protein
MKKLIIALALSTIAAGAIARDVQVDGYYRKDGTYVAPHHRTSPDSRRDNNYGSQGNMNPYTGQMGTIDPYIQPQPQPYAQPPYRQPQQNNIFDPVQPRRR